jgi:hypothetical protein
MKHLKNAYNNNINIWIKTWKLESWVLHYLNLFLINFINFCLTLIACSLILLKWVSHHETNFITWFDFSYCVGKHLYCSVFRYFHVIFGQSIGFWVRNLYHSVNVNLILYLVISLHLSDHRYFNFMDIQNCLSL